MTIEWLLYCFDDGLIPYCDQTCSFAPNATVIRSWGLDTAYGFGNAGKRSMYIDYFLSNDNCFHNITGADNFVRRDEFCGRFRMWPEWLFTMLPVRVLANQIIDNRIDRDAQLEPGQIIPPILPPFFNPPFVSQ